MEKTELKELLLKYREQECTEEEKLLLENWIIDVSFSEYEISERELREDLKEIRNQIPGTSGRRLWPQIAMAAALLLLIGLAGLLYTPARQNEELKSLRAGVLSPQWKATLILDNGKEVSLPDAVFQWYSYDAGVRIGKTNAGEPLFFIKNNAEKTGSFNRLVTSVGERCVVSLPDGTRVHLEAGSTLKFSANFDAGSTRTVELSGEGLFEVATNHRRPFIVRSKRQSVEAIGTSFIVSSYPDDPVIKTTLLEGAVKVITPGVTRLLRVGEVNLNDGKSLRTVKSDQPNADDWKKGNFILEGDIPAVMRKIARSYNVKVVYDPSFKSRDTKLYASFQNGKKLEDVLHIMEVVGEISFRIEGNRVTVEGCCQN